MDRLSRPSRRSFLTAGAATVGGAVLGAGCDAQKKGSGGADGSQEKPFVFHYVTHGSNADTFWAAQSNGWDDFCNAYNVDGRYIGTQLDGDIGKMRANLDAVLGSGGGDGLLVVLSNVGTLEEPVRRAIQDGLPVFVANIPDFREGEQKIPYLRYAGGEPIRTGEANAKMTVRAFKKLTGRAPKRSVYLVHVPGVEVLIFRRQGMRQVFDVEGTVFEDLVVKMDPTQCQQAVRAYVNSTPDLETIQTGSSRVAAWSVQALREIGKLGNINKPYEEGKVYVGAIDLDEELLNYIADGDCIGTVDEQPYMQGWYGAQLLYHWVKYRFLPGRDISTGPFVIQEPALAKRLAEQAKHGIRA